MILAPLLGSATVASAGESLATRVEAQVDPPRDAEPSAVEKLLADPTWKAGALKFLAQHRSFGGPPSAAPAARASGATPLPLWQRPLRALSLQVSGTQGHWSCELTTRLGSRQLSQQGVVSDGEVRLAGLVEGEDDVHLRTVCRMSGCLLGCNLDDDRALPLARSPESIALGDSVVLNPTFSVTDPDAMSGPDASPASPRLVAAGVTPDNIASAIDSVSLRESDQTDYVRVYPTASRTAALLCAEASRISDSVRATQDDSEVAIGAFVLDDRCLAVSVSAWNGVVFHVVSPLEGFKYQIFSLSSEEKPDLALVAWYVARRLMSDPNQTPKRSTDASRELLRAFDLRLEKDRQSVPRIGDGTAAALVDMLADIERGAP